RWYAGSACQWRHSCASGRAEWWRMRPKAGRRGYDEAIFVCEARRLDAPMNFDLEGQRSNRLVCTVLFNGFVAVLSASRLHGYRVNELEVSVKFFVSGSFGLTP